MTYVDLVLLLRRVQEEPGAYLEVRFCGLKIHLYRSRLDPSQPEKRSSKALDPSCCNSLKRS